jgi:hypothetical protein
MPISDSISAIAMLPEFRLGVVRRYAGYNRVGHCLFHLTIALDEKFSLIAFNAA